MGRACGRSNRQANMKGIPEGVFGGDDRAVAPVLGVILLFGIAAIGLSVWQTTVIPSQNADTEFKHYMDVQGDMGDLRQAHLETVNSGEPQAPTLKLGVAYTTRIIGVNPPDPSGTVRDEDIGSFRLEEAPDSTSDSMITTADVCGVNQPSTDRLRYDPSYNRLSDRDAPPVMYENTVLYRETADGEFLVEGDQLLIQGSTINILPVQTDLDRTGRSTSIDLSSQGYLVEKDLEAGATPTIIVPTKIPASTWENELLDSQMGDSVSKVLSEGDSLPDGGTIGENEVGIVLNEKGDPFPWTVRCAITTDGGTTDFTEVAKPPQILNGGVGQGGITEHTPDSNTDKIVIPNGKWINVDNIAGIKYGNAETVPVEGNNNVGGEGVLLEYTIRDDTGEEVEVKVEAAYDPGNDEYVGEVGFSDDPNNSPNWMELRQGAARRIVETGVEDGPNILDDSNYYDTFQNNDNIGPLVDAIRGMEEATLQTTNVAGRVDMKVESGELILDVADEDEFKTVKVGETSEIEFDVTATGEVEGSENVDLVVRDSSGQRIDSVGDRADRETLTDVDGEESFTLTWEPDWENIDNGEYQILVEGESDQTFATVEVYQGGNVRLNVTIDNATSPVDYGDTVETNVTVRNVGDTPADDAQLDLSMADQDGPQEQFDLAAGENTTLTLEYDTGENLDSSNTGEKTLKATWNDESTDTETVVVERPDIILDPQVEDLTAGEDGQTQTFGFTLGEDLTEDDEISVDVSDTGDAVEYDGNDGSWTIVQGDGTELSPDLDNGKVTYKVGSDDSEGDTIRFQGSGISAASAESDIRYDVEYRVESADSYAEGENGDTNSTSFESKDDAIEVEILDADSPVEYGETVEANIRVENVGSTDAEDVQLDVSMAGQDIPQSEFDLEAGEETTITTYYDTGENLDSSDTGGKTLEVTWNSESTDTYAVVVEQPDVIHEPYAEDVTATDGNQTQAFGFTLDEELEKGDEISVDISDSGDDIEYDNDDANWTIVEGDNDAQLSLELDNGKVIYVVGADGDAGDTIRFEGAYVDASSAESDALYDVEYRVERANSYAEGDNGDTNSTSFESTGVILEPSAENVADRSEQSQTFNFTLGADLAEGDEITINVSDTGDDIRYDGDDDSWTVVQGPASAQVTPEIDNGTVTYRAGGEETENSTIRIRADFVNASSAESGVAYDIEYRVESAESLADGNDGDTNTASFESTD